MMTLGCYLHLLGGGTVIAVPGTLWQRQAMDDLQRGFCQVAVT